MNRYLINFAYIGSKFSGIAKQRNTDNDKSVQAVIEKALKSLKPLNSIDLQISSRTDAGVHALNTTAHIDLELNSYPPHHPNEITQKLNNSLRYEPIRILRTKLVDNTFSARRDAITRTYLYRLAVAKQLHSKEISIKHAQHTMFIPIEEYDRCYFMLNNGFDIERAQEAAKMFIGLHDFRTFMSTSREQRTLHPLYARRLINSITIRPGNTLVTPENFEQTTNEYTFWDIEFCAKSYIYRQIRKTVSTIIAFAEGRIDTRDIYEMLTIPSKHSWKSGLAIAPAHGLYLAKIEYPDHLSIDNNISVAQ